MSKQFKPGDRVVLLKCSRFIGRGGDTATILGWDESAKAYLIKYDFLPLDQEGEKTNRHEWLANTKDMAIAQDGYMPDTRDYLNAVTENAT